MISKRGYISNRIPELLKSSTMSNTIMSKDKERQKAITKFVSRVARKEAKRSQAKVGDIREIFKLVNELTEGQFYDLIVKSEKAR